MKTLFLANVLHELLTLEPNASSLRDVLLQGLPLGKSSMTESANWYSAEAVFLASEDTARGLLDFRMSLMDVLGKTASTCKVHTTCRAWEMR